MNKLDIFTKDDYIQEGVNPSPGILIVACTVGDDEDDPKNRIALKTNESWLEFGFMGEAVLSIDAAKNGMGYVLGENGSVIQFDWRASQSRDMLRASRNLFVNNSVSENGPLRRIRIIGGEVICCGSVGQVYQLKQGKFIAFPQLKIDGMDLTIEDISGTSLQDLIVVTSEGYSARFNGSEWKNLDLPINVNLTSVCALDDGRYAIAGYKGTILIGKPEKWEIFTNRDSELIYWGITAWNKSIYISHSGGIDILKETVLDSLNIPGSDRMEFGNLTTGPDGVWSCTGNTIGLITVDGWNTILQWESKS